MIGKNIMKNKINREWFLRRCGPGRSGDWNEIVPRCVSTHRFLLIVLVLPQVAPSANRASPPRGAQTEAFPRVFYVRYSSQREWRWGNKGDARGGIWVARMGPGPGLAPFSGIPACHSRRHELNGDTAKLDSGYNDFGAWLYTILTHSTTSVPEIATVVPASFPCYQTPPNPFNPGRCS
jgi:hypothetical protein